MEEYKKNPQILNELSKENQDKIIKFIELDKLTEKLIERKQAFEEGKKEDVELEEYIFNDSNNINIS